MKNQTRNLVNAEVGTRNAEQQNQGRPVCSEFRLPRSAFGVGP